MINNMLFISLILTAAVYGLREGRKKGEGEEREREGRRERGKGTKNLLMDLEIS